MSQSSTVIPRMTDPSPPFSRIEDALDDIREGKLVIVVDAPGRENEGGLRMMVAHNETPYQTAFTVSIEAREGIATGISAADRAHTIRVAVDPTKGARDLAQPGHVFPLRARSGGVLERTGQTE